jgi:hypothetical protein
MRPGRTALRIREPSLPARPASPQIPHKSGSLAASPQKAHGQSGTPRHNPARMLKWIHDPLLAFTQVKRLTGPMERSGLTCLQAL